MGKTMYVNFKKGEARQFGNRTVTPMDDGVFPVEVLFNENSSAGEVRPLSTGSVRLTDEKGATRPYSFIKDENLILGHGDLSETGLRLFRDKDDPAWAMKADERDYYIEIINAHGEVDEDDLSEMRSREDMFGTESLREIEQEIVGMDEDELFAVQDFMRQNGMLDGGYQSSDYTTYGNTDTGRYLQIELKDQPGVLRNVYEAPISGSTHQFWDMEPAEGKVNFMSVKDGDYEVKGVYVGQPFQAERDAAASVRFPQPDAEGPQAGQPQAPAGPYAKLMGAIRAMDGAEGPGGTDLSGPDAD